MVKRNRGFGLMEMLVVMSILAIIASAAFYYSSNWINQNRINEFDQQLKRAFGKAKAEALKNPHGATGDQAVSTIEFSGGQLTVSRCDDASCTSATSVWSSDIPTGIAATASGSALSKLELNSRGLLISQTTPVTYNLKKGTFNDGRSPRTLY